MKGYNWFYTNKNFITKIDQKKLYKFYNSTYDYELGLEPLPNSQKEESLGKGEKSF